MTVDNLRCPPVVLGLFLIATWPCVLHAEESSSPSAAPSTSASPANSNLQREYARLAQLLNSTDSRGQDEAAESLLKVRPSDVADLNTRKLIARGYRSLATEKNGFHKDKAVQGLVIWGGKYSVPILVEMLDNDKFGTDEIYDALGKLKDPQGAEAVTRHLGNFFTHEKAFNSLRKMGPAAEDALIKAAPSNDADVSVAAAQLLGEVGGKKASMYCSGPLRLAIRTSSWLRANRSRKFACGKEAGSRRKRRALRMIPTRPLPKAADRLLILRPAIRAKIP